MLRICNVQKEETMIYTLTVNPSLDYMIKLESLTLGAMQRTKDEKLIYGGKGINVSLMLKELGLDSIAYGFIGGETAQMYEAGVQAMGLQTAFLPVKNGFTRINIKINAEEETEINGQGTQPDQEELTKMIECLSSLGQGDILILSGSVQKSIPPTFYAQLMQVVSANGALCVVDTNGESLLHAIKEKPFLIKTNIHELEEVFQCPMKEGILFSSMQALQQKGVKNVLVSCGGDGAYLLDEQGAIYYGKSAHGIVVSTIGCGDSMTAGFLYGWLQHGNYKEAFRMGLAAGSASAFTYGIAKGEEVKRLADQIEIEILRESDKK